MDVATKTGINTARKFGDKYAKKLMDTATKTGINATKTASEGVVQKTGALIGNKIADKITSLGKSKNKQKEDKTNGVEEIYIPPEKRQRITDD